ncbi:MAG: lasso RiPP family leader peptide-containing protein [Candidatus Eisenbacteria bacterium]|nr:lasso RiPP family leader peptide-containing protein [Candidatus Eisenbacteria bacterium]
MDSVDKRERESYERPELLRHGSLKEITLLSHDALYVGKEETSAKQTGG